MKKNDNNYYYSFTNYNSINTSRQSLNKIRVIVTIFIILITIILIIISNNIQSNIKSSEESASIAIMQSQIEEEKNKELQEKAKKEEEEQKKLPVLTDIGRQNMENIYHSETKRVFLTFDDGPSNITPQILDTLKNENVKASFFVLGCNVEIFPETINRVYNEGHFIGNHGYSHVYSSIYASPQAVLDEFNQCNDAVKNAIGKTEYNSHLFRFPGGLPGGKYADLKQEAKQLLNENNILNIDWNALTGDAETRDPTPEYIMQRLQETIGDKNSVVLLMHDAEAKKVTADMLSEIIKYLREQGYEFKTFYDIIQ